jgi:hypothetical protein
MDRFINRHVRLFEGFRNEDFGSGRFSPRLFQKFYPRLSRVLTYGNKRPDSNVASACGLTPQPGLDSKPSCYSKRGNVNPCQKGAGSPSLLRILLC